MVQLRSWLLLASSITTIVGVAVPRPVDGSAINKRDANPGSYSGVFINRYEESDEKEKREAEAKPETYSGTFINRYEETPETEKRDAEAEPKAKATYSGTFINRYDEVAKE